MKNKDPHFIHEFIHIPPYLDCREYKYKDSVSFEWYQIKKGPGNRENPGPSTNIGDQRGSESPVDKGSIA